MVIAGYQVVSGAEMSPRPCMNMRLYEQTNGIPRTKAREVNNEHEP